LVGKISIKVDFAISQTTNDADGVYPVIVKKLVNNGNKTGCDFFNLSRSLNL
jgi:hypothetical protein